MDVRDRVKEMRLVPADQLIANPSNWRRHPQAQQRALSAVLDAVGFAGAVIAREDDDGHLIIIDGHARAEMVGKATVPVLVTDLTEAEADVVLATYDPIGAMAETNNDALTQLLASISTDNETISELLATVAAQRPALTENAYTQGVDTPIYEPTGEQPRLDELTDRAKADELIQEIEGAGLDEDIEKFLVDAAMRHIAFNFGRIANYYAHAPANVQTLMERSALVIIDYDQAIAHGFVRLVGDIDAAFHKDYPDA
jgi:hypothetical protein